MHELAFQDGGFWLAVFQIIMIDILLGGDNAVVIALACRRLPEAQRKKGIFWGVFGAVALRVVLIFFALTLLSWPWVKIIGGALLLWIGVKLLLPEHDDGHHEIQASDHLLGAIKTIIVADAVMSLDNVIGVAGAARGNMVLVVFGILISVPIIVWGSQLVLRLMDRFPWVITLGAGLLGWIGGEMLFSDIVLQPWTAQLPAVYGHAAAVAGAVLVITLGYWLSKRRPPPGAHPS